jgi:hypothetical protein
VKRISGIITTIFPSLEPQPTQPHQDKVVEKMSEDPKKQEREFQYDLQTFK